MTDAPHITYFNMGPWPLFVGFTTSRKAFRKEMKRLSITGVDFVANDHSHACTHSFTAKGGLTIVMTMDKANDPSVEQIASLLAHEAVHVAQILWESIGEDRPGAEAESYLVQYIVQSCMQVALDTGRVRSTEP